MKGSDKLAGNSVTHAWIAKDPLGRYVYSSLSEDDEGAFLGGWRNSRLSYEHLDPKREAWEQLGWRVVKVEIREVER